MLITRRTPNHPGFQFLSSERKPFYIVPQTGVLFYCCLELFQGNRQPTCEGQRTDICLVENAISGGNIVNASCYCSNTLIRSLVCIPPVAWGILKTVKDFWLLGYWSLDINEEASTTATILFCFSGTSAYSFGVLHRTNVNILSIQPVCVHKDPWATVGFHFCVLILRGPF